RAPRSKGQPQGDPGRAQRPPPSAASRHQRTHRPRGRTYRDTTDHRSTDSGAEVGVEDLQGGPQVSQRFIVTKEHRRFTEVADAVRRRHTLGVCFGSAGVGTTRAARRYAHYEKARDLLPYWGPRYDNDAKRHAALPRSRTVLYAPGVLTTPRNLKD